MWRGHQNSLKAEGTQRQTVASKRQRSFVLVVEVCFGLLRRCHFFRLLAVPMKTRWYHRCLQYLSAVAFVNAPLILGFGGFSVFLPRWRYNCRFPMFRRQKWKVRLNWQEENVAVGYGITKAVSCVPVADEECVSGIGGVWSYAKEWRLWAIRFSWCSTVKIEWFMKTWLSRIATSPRRWAKFVPIWNWNESQNGNIVPSFERFCV